MSRSRFSLNRALPWALVLAGATAWACGGKSGADATNSNGGGNGNGVPGLGGGVNSAGGASNSTGGASNPNGGMTGQVIDPAVFVPAEGGLRRLTLTQYRNSITDLFGAGALPTTQFEADSALSGFVSIAAARLALSATITEQFESAALEIAHAVLSDVTARAALLGCTPAGATDDTCTSAFLGKIGRRAWRRPLTATELSGLTALVNPIQTSLNDFYGGLEYGIAALLESPHFLYREEISSSDPANPGLGKFDDYELATRLSFFLWNTTPDDALLDAADAHQLTSTDGFNTQVSRLLASPRSTDAVKNFFTEYFRLTDLDHLPQLPTTFPQNTATVGPAMREETARFMANIALTPNTDYRTMFDSRDTFVNSELAQLYGLPAVAGTDFVPVTLPDSGMRAGFLGQASFLALNAHATGTSPTYRGKFIQEMLRCVNIPPPPMNVPPLPDDANAATETMRQKLEMHRSVDPCRTCHAIMDPMGLAFENFDAMGSFRTMDVGQMIDPSGDLDGQPFAGPRELETLLRNDAKVGECAARNLYRYALGHVEGAEGNEAPAINQIVAAFSGSQFQFTSLVQAIVTSPAFSTAALPSQDPVMNPNGAGGSGSGGAPATGGTGGTGTVAQGGSPPVVANPTYANDIAPIIAANCEPCHTMQMKGGFNWTYDSLVTNSAITSALAGTCKYLDGTKRRVVPGDPDHSLLWIKIALDEHQNTANGCGDHMPQAPSAHVVTTAELDTIHTWIVQGAMP
ncbi:MAG TPA: DUF1592 domain-containing protein [Polyangiaceae bacterium]|nr:DUF1592 domain-containing protein [Polyangiaceae bacterium]